MVVCVDDAFGEWFGEGRRGGSDGWKVEVCEFVRSDRTRDKPRWYGLEHAGLTVRVRPTSIGGRASPRPHIARSVASAVRTDGMAANTRTAGNDSIRIHP